MTAEQWIGGALMLAMVVIVAVRIVHDKRLR